MKIIKNIFSTIIDLLIRFSYICLIVVFISIVVHFIKD